MNSYGCAINAKINGKNASLSMNRKLVGCANTGVS
jgi:hypothetical protein